MNNAVMFSSATDEWSTPQEFFDALDAEFHFTLDVAASAANRKHRNYLGPDNPVSHLSDGLLVKWPEAAYLDSHGAIVNGQYTNTISNSWRGACWMNPPYSRGLQGKFIAKAATERLRGVTTVALLPARTDTKAFHAHIYDASKWQPRDGIEIRLLPGRLKFGGAANSAPFPSMVVIFRGADTGRRGA